MKKWRKKINRRVNYYDRSWDVDVAECQKSEWPMLVRRAYRMEGFRNGAEWMLKEIIHLLRQKKYKTEKFIRDIEEDKDKTILIFAAAVYSRIIKDLTE
jgi:hypothetical protein